MIVLVARPVGTSPLSGSQTSRHSVKIIKFWDMDTLSTPAQGDSSGANPSSVKSDDSSPQRGSGSTSPPPNCAICLGTCKNKSFTDSCLHQFCFSCLLTWSKVKAECPLCKQAFRSIIHNVRSNHQYEEYLVVQRQNEDPSRIGIDRITAATQRFRYRTTFTLPRRETIAIQQLLRHYPFVADVFPPMGTRPFPARRRRSPASFRRTVYRHNLWARLLPDFTGRFRDCTPDFYRYNSTQMHRLVPWLNRELHYLLNENVGHISYVMSRILDLLPQHHINSAEFREAMHRYFGDRTEHFLHELYCYACTPYDLAGYDRNVQYTTGLPTTINEVISSSDSDASVDSDIVMVSSSEPAEPPPGPSRVPAPIYPQTYISQPSTADNVIPIETISHSDTDDDSSEVMLVGYIKPPQDRTPEIVDLLGSDSDVIVQDAPSEPPASSVKVTLKRHRSQNSCENARSKSDSDSSFVPSPPKRRRRDCSDDTTTSATSRSTPERDSPRVPASFPVYNGTYSSSSSSTSSSSSDYEPTSTRNKTKKRSSASARGKRSGKRSSRSRHIDLKSIPLPENMSADKRHSKKSHSGKGVKSSNKNFERSTVPPEPSVPPESLVNAERTEPPVDQSLNVLDQPSTSGVSNHYKRKSNKERNRRRRGSRESRRLRSVVNVMYNSHRKSNEPNSNCVSVPHVTATNNGIQEKLVKDELTENTEQSHSRDITPMIVKPPDSSTDSEDNLPLNVTLQNMLNPPTFG